MNLQDLFSIAMTDAPGPGVGDGAPEPGPQQSQQPEAQPAQPQEPEASNQPRSVSESDGGGGGGCFKWVVGCGCISMVLVLLLGTIGVGVAFWKAPDAVGVDGWGEIGELVETATQVADGMEPVEEGGGLAAMGSSQDEDGAGIDDFFELLDVPVTSADFGQYRNHLRDWEQTESVREFEELVEEAERLEEEQDDSIFAGLRALRVFTQFAFAANDLGRDFATFGDGEFHRTNSRILPLVRVSRLGADSEYEPYEQQVADALIEDHDENREDFQRVRAIIEEAGADEDFDVDDLSEEQQRELMEAYTEQFLFITSAINRQTLEHWAGLSDEERKEIVDHVEAPHNLIARFLAAAHVDDPQHLYHWQLFAL